MHLHYYIDRTEVGPVSTLGIGRLLFYGREIFRSFTLENTKCRIAPGTYTARYTRSPRFSREASKKARKKDPSARSVDVYTWEIFGIIDSLNPASPDRPRAGIRIHPVNFAKDLLGCVAPGMEVKDLDRDGNVDIARSREALFAFEKACGKARSMNVTIIDPV